MTREQNGNLVNTEMCETKGHLGLQQYNSALAVSLQMQDS